MALLVVVAALVVGGVQTAGGDVSASGRLTGAAILLAATAALYWRRRRPAVVLAVTAAAAVGYYLLGYPLGPEPLPFVVALYATAEAGRRMIAVAAVPVAVGLVLAADVTAGRTPEGEDLVAVAAVLVAAVGLGELARSRREQRQAYAEQAATQERLRIARDLHDTLAHQLTAISVQAGAALHKRDSRPELAYPALETVRQVAGDALREVRAVLGAVRVDPAGGQNACEAVPALGARAGLAVTMSVSGEAVALPPHVDAATYRIAQEALTNVGRHAGVTEVEVRLAYLPRHVEIEVLDRGNGGAGGDGRVPGGHGIAGMRERVTALGGRFSAGPRPGGGFRVWAMLPR
ncbi:sensor histidine kinase [Micromonospora krabiensis]|uniref:histidine kinase n=1 Tax=Micromonospora krabiensis TaxID=307121 RepID=A0A1C3MX18_9ACTN|nr:sensor histidine kinase [Micromonospora krabiensis]SBV24879.1 Signal transduction histidine kinase [Micromonospora krabiensis]